MLSQFLHYSFIKYQLRNNPGQFRAMSCKFWSKRQPLPRGLCVQEPAVNRLLEVGNT